MQIHEAVAELRAAVGEADWAEGNFGDRPDVLRGVYEMVASPRRAT
jgi:hypothetical protein